jgi:hypothetical protein
VKSRSNGCGPKGFLGRLIPDSFLGVSVHAACNYHDEGYSKGGSEKNRKKADQKFLEDMLLAIDRRGGIFIAKNIRKLGAYFYYFGVRLFGSAYFSG